MRPQIEFVKQPLDTHVQGIPTEVTQKGGVFFHRGDFKYAGADQASCPSVHRLQRGTSFCRMGEAREAVCDLDTVG